ncbi:AI-2E family transporter [Kitasatospora atroaurantiaca]|uniref:Putative PurR-regulated permease PerM n=1 Tax=Kitasatospora atroaurantiaca TaxID=285545 RepID=A0A561EK26_9ACTN|nr:AI-2E family transporter [Kitasatospora atroaurantiaca]TWE15968.1 putative PurR-regulated permease PerM [Kitasatospora atroaurantiaca]
MSHRPGEPEPGGQTGSRRPSGGRRVLRSRGPRAVVRAVPRSPGAPPVHAGLRQAADYAWRLLVVGVAVYAVVNILGRFQLIAVAIFLALVITSVLRPLADLLARRLPRAIAVLICLIGALVVLAGLLSLVGNAVAGEAATLGRELQGGLTRIERWLQGPPFRVSAGTVSGLRGKISSYISSHRSALISTAVSGAGRLVEVATGAALSLFCSLFFLYSGDRMWLWSQRQLPPGARQPWDRAGRAAWRTFAGYTRGIVIVAATNAALVGIALFALQVPLALPLTLLEFFASFVPLIGSPVAMVVASVVALAARGPVTAIIVLLLIVVIGQIEGHVLHPLVMSWAVSLHPVVVAVSVLAGGIAAGVVGAVVAVPAVSVIWAVISELRTPAPAEPPPEPVPGAGDG